MEGAAARATISVTVTDAVGQQAMASATFILTKEWTDPITGMKFVWIEGGDFQMGSETGDSDEQPVHPVHIDGFYMGKYEVTQVEWKKVMGSTNNPSWFKGDNRRTSSETMRKLYVSDLLSDERIRPEDENPDNTCMSY
jgi:formylglycine-generating enzyme required for sulfatase activity